MSSRRTRRTRGGEERDETVQWAACRAIGTKLGEHSRQDGVARHLGEVGYRAEQRPRTGTVNNEKLTAAIHRELDEVSDVQEHAQQCVTLPRASWAR